MGIEGRRIRAWVPGTLSGEVVVVGKVKAWVNPTTGVVEVHADESEETPLVIYAMHMYLAPRHEFSACVYHHEGKYGVVVFEDGGEASHGDGLRRFPGAHRVVWRALQKVFQRLRVWLQTREYEVS